MVVLPSDHHLAALKAISPRDLVGETFVTVSDTAPVLRAVIDNYLKRSGINIRPASRGGPSRHGNVLDSVDGRCGAVTCLRPELSPSICNESSSQGDTPTIELVLGYKKSNKSTILKLLLSRLDELVAGVSKKTQ